MNRQELKSKARGLIKQNMPHIFIVVAVYIAVTTILSELEYRMPGTKSIIDLYAQQLETGVMPELRSMFDGFRPAGSALATLIRLITPVVTIGITSYCLKITRHENADFKTLLDGFLFPVKVIALSIVMGFFVFLWTLLLIVPGIVAAYRYSQSYYILLENPSKGIFACIRESKKLMAGRKLDLFILDLSFLGWIFLDIVITLITPFPFPIMSLWLTPYMGLTHAEFYNRLSGYTTNPAA